MGNSCSCFNSDNDGKNCDLSNLMLSQSINQKSTAKEITSILGIEVNKSSSLFKSISDPYINRSTKNHNFRYESNTFISGNDIINYKWTKVNSVIRGFLFRKKYNDFLKTQLMDNTNELYIQFILKAKNKKVSDILNYNNNPNKQKTKNNSSFQINEKILKYLQTSWKEFYEEDPTKEITSKINKTKKYLNGLIFKYKPLNLQNDKTENCLEAISCYKGLVDLYTNKKCGYGELITIDGSHQMGTFYNDEFIGWNTFVNNNGELFVGLFKNNKLNGKGLKYFSENDHIYMGDFLNGKRHGYGKDYRNTSKYEGEFEYDKKCGKGKIVFESGDVYEGEFKDNKFSGYGHYKWKLNEHEYIGYYANGKFHGEGLYKWGNREYYKGEYVNGIKQGKGEIGYNDGKKIFVNFENGKPVGTGVFQNEKGECFNVEFENGKLKNKDIMINH